jgi:cold shock CspA family protein
VRRVRSQLDRAKTDTALLTGRVKFFDNLKGFGFATLIGTGEQADVFLHVSELDVDYDDPQEGDIVTFVIGKLRGRRAAKRIKIVADLKARE